LGSVDAAVPVSATELVFSGNVATSVGEGLQSKQINMVEPSILLKEPSDLGLCRPHFMQDMVSIDRPPVPKGDPPFFDL